MSLLQLGTTIFGGTEKIIPYLRSKGLLAAGKTCSRCGGSAMIERPRTDVSDGVSWWCRGCKGRKTIREGSFFSKSRLTLQQWLLLVYWWSRQYPVTDAANEAEVDKGTAVDVYRWLREVCSTRLLRTPIVLGGAGVIVEIDESLFRHKPKHHRGRATTQEVWVFGLVDTSRTPALGYMEIVHRRDAATHYIPQVFKLFNNSSWAKGAAIIQKRLYAIRERRLIDLGNTVTLTPKNIGPAKTGPTGPVPPALHHISSPLR